MRAGRAARAGERADRRRAQLARAERAVLDVPAGDRPVLDVLAGDGDRGVGAATKRGEQRQVGDGGGVAAREPLDDESHWIASCESDGGQVFRVPSTSR